MTEQCIMPSRPIGMIKLGRIPNPPIRGCISMLHHMPWQRGSKMLQYTWEALEGYAFISDICKIFDSVKLDDFQAFLEYLVEWCHHSHNVKAMSWNHILCVALCVGKHCTIIGMSVSMKLEIKT
jgi:hypothetical protein